MIKLFGLLLWMGLDMKPSSKQYWSRATIYSNEFVKDIGIPRNRFESLLNIICFSNNEECPVGDRFFKVQPLIDSLNVIFRVA